MSISYFPMEQDDLDNLCEYEHGDLQRIVKSFHAEIEQLRAAFKFITDWHEASWRNRLNSQASREVHKKSWQRCLARAKEVRGE